MTVKPEYEELKREIEERKRAEEALRESEAHLNEAQSIAHIGSWYFDIATSTYTASDEAFRIFGIEPQAIVPDYEFKKMNIHPDDRENVLKSFNDAIYNNKPYRVEYRIILPDGTEKYVLSHGVLHQNDDGTPECLAGTVQDITERKLAEEGVRESEERQKLLVYRIPLAIVVHDADTRIILSNPKAQELLGLTDDQLMGKTVIDPDWNFLDAYGEILPHDLYPVNKVLADRKSLRDMVLGIRRPGHLDPIWVLVNAVPVMNNEDEMQQVIVTFVDITEHKKAEEAVRKSEEKYRKVYQNLPVPYQSLNKDGCFLDVNPTWLDTLGYARDEVLGKWFGDFLAPGFAELFREKFPKFKEAGQVCNVPYRMIKKDGGEIYVEYFGRVGLTGSGEFMQTHCIFQDISARVKAEAEREEIFDALENTNKELAAANEEMEAINEALNATNMEMCQEITERKRAEEALRESEEKYRELFNTANDAIFALQVSDRGLVFNDCNPKVAEMFGCKIEDIIGKSPVDFSPKTQKDGRPSEEKAKEYVMAAISGEPQRFEWLHSQLDGTVFDAEVSLNRVTVGDETYLQAIVRNITERKMAEEALRKSESRFRSIYESTLVGIILADKEGRILNANPVMYSMLGYSEEELKTMRFKDISHPEGLEENLKLFNEMIEGKRDNYHIEKRYFHKSGNIVWADVIVSAVRNEKGEFQYCNAIIEDITERKKAEEEKKDLWNQLLQSQKLESIGRLTGGIAHDFNNLLTGILGYGEIALRDIEKDNPLHRKLKVIVDNTEKAANLVKQLLAFSRKQVLEMRLNNLNIIVENMSKMLIRVIGEDIKLELEIKKPVSNVSVDETQMDQVLMNLIVNARDAMPGGGTLTIKTEDVSLDEDYCKTYPEVKPGPYVMLSVEDTGVGMSKEVQDKIFEPFFTTKEKGAGTGLGLSTVFGIVKQHNGSVSLYSELGKGTVFKVYIPVAEGAVKEVKKDESDELPGGNETVLVVDDDDVIRSIAKELLERLGYKVLVAKSGEDAIEISNKTDEVIDLILTDVVMTGINGWDAAEEIREKRPEMKVIFASGYMDNTVVLNNIMENKMPFINKPFKQQTLARKIREVLDEKEKYSISV